MRKFAAILTVAAVMPMTAAEVAPESYPDLELGKEYTLEFMKTFYGKFTPAENGQLVEYGSVPVYLLNGSELALMTEADGYRYAGYINGKQAHQFSVKAGTTYYFKDDFVMNNGTFSIELNPELALVESMPEIGSVYDPATNAHVEFIFNQNLTIGKVIVSVGELSTEAEIHISGSTVSVAFNEELRRWYNDDKIKRGENLTITFSELSDGLGNRIDDMSFVYKTVRKPVELKEYTLPAELLSWYDDEATAAKAVFTFTGDMGDNPDVELCYAPVDLGYEYSEKVKATVNGNVVTVDFGGVRRTSAEMSTSGRTDTQIYLRLIHMKDATGQTVWSDGQGTIGSFLYEIPFVEVARLNITSEFTPSAGASLENVKEVKIYFNCADHLTYSGVAFTSGNEKVVVNPDKIEVDRISDSEIELTVPVPDGWNSKENIVISLEGLSGDDGFDHTAEISAKFNGFTLIYCSLKDGARMKSLAEGTIVKVETNLGDEAKLTFAIDDVFEPVEMTSSGDGVFMLTMPRTVVFDMDKNYTVRFTAQPGGEETLTIVGETAPYDYSDLELSSVTPAAGTTIAPDAEIKLTFTGLVSIASVDGSAPFTAKALAGGEAGFAYEWGLTLDNVSEGDVSVAFAATDMDFKTLKGNEGVDASSFFTMTFHVSSAGIVSVESDGVEQVYYDLQGRRVSTPDRGIYILKGKKIKL